MSDNIVITAKAKDKSDNFKCDFSYNYGIGGNIATYSVKIDAQNNSCVGNSVTPKPVLHNQPRSCRKRG